MTKQCWVFKQIDESWLNPEKVYFPRMKETQCWFLKNRRKTMLVFQVNLVQKLCICPSPLCDCGQRWSFQRVQSLLVLVCKQSFALFLVPELLIHLKVYRSNNLCGDYLIWGFTESTIRWKWFYPNNTEYCLNGKLPRYVRRLDSKQIFCGFHF